MRCLQSRYFLLLFAIRQLDEPARRQVAEVLLETQMDAQLNYLLQQLAQKSPVDDISDADIAAEVQAVQLSGSRG